MSEKQQMIFFSFFSWLHFYYFLGREIARKRGNWNFERWEWNVGQLRVLLSSEFCKLLSIAHKWEDSNFSHERKSSLATHWKKNSLDMNKNSFRYTKQKFIFFWFSLARYSLISPAVFLCSYSYEWKKNCNSTLVCRKSD